MSEPLAFLTAALDAAERDAERLRDDLWWLGQEQVIRVYGSGDGLIAGADQAIHDLLAAYGPDVILRRIAADRKLLAEIALGVEYEAEPLADFVVRNLAEGWGWSEEEGPRSG